MNEIVKYEGEGMTELPVMVDAETVWLTQAQMAMLFQTTSQNITMHLKNIYEDTELDAISTCKNFLQVRTEGGRQVERKSLFYNLDAIICVGYRIKSKRATQFRQWATQVLRDHLIKGYTIRQPVSVEHLQEMKQNLEYQIQDLRKQIENLDVVSNEQYSELYQALIELTSQKKAEENKPRRKIGF
ncbi:hypothetical protein FACS189452_07260 [Bacteroidia bacterium]|nr:hypothetical protein FACS189452_07260 [Bacteroidia bacterium]